VSRISGDGNWLGLCVSFENILHVYHLPDMRLARTLDTDETVAGFEFSPDNQEFAAASSASVQVWNTTTWEQTRCFSNFVSVIYAPGHHAKWLSADYRTAGLYADSTGELLLPLPKGMLPIAHSRDGRYVAFTIDSRRIQIWDLVEVRKQFRDLGIDWEDH
jgi:WD40 repeat protein